MQKAAEVLDNFGVATKRKLFPPHRTPDLVNLNMRKKHDSRGIKVIIAGAGGYPPTCQVWLLLKRPLPVIGVPVKSRALSGVDSLIPLFRCQVGYLSQPWRSVKRYDQRCPSFALRLLGRGPGYCDSVDLEEQGKIAEESTNELN